MAGGRGRTCSPEEKGWKEKRKKKKKKGEKSLARAQPPASNPASATRGGIEKKKKGGEGKEKERLWPWSSALTGRRHSSRPDRRGVQQKGGEKKK